ncbi:hypothetical protein FCOL_11545 [Flavobacterium columnare ATCC 49512]|uniref:Uncharacterized protein n=1 Tax=Flavobacterium columnare (strain ATCC 49512 / CIP 103533 / TG 44/87) TaxID=1041826 RepID=G8X7Z6_FLACA|nr:hypothetical protein [Flavobacterium columnare]AEW87110.1 hypothetical protein FCOL_11545 [Flavobacterium columnare ATCC 49512]
MIKKIFLLLISLTAGAQTIQIENEKVTIDGVPVLQLKVISNRFKYDLYDLNNNLMLHAKMIPCRGCKEINEIQFELISPNYSDVKRLKVLEESFSRSREFIKMLCQYHVLNQKGLDLERLFTIDEERLKLEPVETKPIEENISTKEFKIVANDLLVHGEKVGFFEQKQESLKCKNYQLNYIKYILFDLDRNLIASYCTIEDTAPYGHPDFFRISEALQIDRLVVRNGVNYVYDTLPKEVIMQFLATKAFQQNYHLGHFINRNYSPVLTDSEQNEEVKYIDKSSEYFLCRHEDIVGIGTFDLVKGFNEEPSFKTGKQHIYFKPLDTDLKPYVIHGKYDEKVIIENHYESNAYIAFDVVNKDVFEIFETIQSAQELRPDWSVFRKIVYENQKFYIALDFKQFIIKDKRKNKGVRLSNKKNRATKQILKYLDIDPEILKKYELKHLDELIQIISVAK